MPGTHHLSSSYSLMPFLGSPCLRPWVCFVSWWHSCCSSPSKYISEFFHCHSERTGHNYQWNGLHPVFFIYNMKTWCKLIQKDIFKRSVPCIDDANVETNINSGLFLIIKLYVSKCSLAFIIYFCWFLLFLKKKVKHPWDGFKYVCSDVKLLNRWCEGKFHCTELDE